MKRSILGLVLVALSMTAAADKATNTLPIYFGGGVGFNKLSGWDDSFGIQFLGGYELGNFGAKGFDFSVEAGYMDTGDFERNFAGGTVSESANGLWGTFVAAYHASPLVDILARAGLDVGDDDGPMFGVGVGFNVNKQLQLRGEFVARDNVDSLQFNVVFYP
ncbi:MAG: hypothetical protein BMS9Abin33_0337 [Gammaproteobacteria bacterium]|nr:MAG: hypothetical protein BMS9Abin33_0337 [Gammaproteobacteria bacterium]